jgi:uncharacterized cysteine cluster protein YcgN (CxxCxxCC family)
MPIVFRRLAGQKGIPFSLAGHKAARTLNHFCVVGYRNLDGSTYAWVHWQEGKALILWEPHVPDAPGEDLGASRRYLRLNKDVVATTDQVNGSTYKVTQAWVQQITHACEVYRERFEISKDTVKKAVAK